MAPNEVLTNFVDIVNNPNVLGAVIRLHQLLSDLVTELINEKLVESHYLEVDRIPFALRIELAVAVGMISKEDRPVLLQFNTRRNEFVHAGKTDFSEKEASDLYNICSAE